MKDYELPSQAISELERTYRSLHDKRQADRVKAVIALSRGWSAVQIADTASPTKKRRLSETQVATFDTATS